LGEQRGSAVCETRCRRSRTSGRVRTSGSMAKANRETVPGPGAGPAHGHPRVTGDRGPEQAGPTNSPPMTIAKVRERIAVIPISPVRESLHAGAYANGCLARPWRRTAWSLGCDAAAAREPSVRPRGNGRSPGPWESARRAARGQGRATLAVGWPHCPSGATPRLPTVVTPRGFRGSLTHPRIQAHPRCAILPRYERTILLGLRWCWCRRLPVGGLPQVGDPATTPSAGSAGRSPQGQRRIRRYR